MGKEKQKKLNGKPPDKNDGSKDKKGGAFNNPNMRRSLMSIDCTKGMKNSAFRDASMGHSTMGLDDFSAKEFPPLPQKKPDPTVKVEPAQAVGGVKPKPAAAMSPKQNSGEGKAVSNTQYNKAELKRHGVLMCCRSCWVKRRQGVEFMTGAKTCSKCPELFNDAHIVYLFKSKFGRTTEIRPRPSIQSSNYKLCAHFINGQPCKIKPCTFAHGEEEIYFWKLPRSKQQIKDPSLTMILCAPNETQDKGNLGQKGLSSDNAKVDFGTTKDHDVVASPKVEPKEEVDLRKHGVYQCCNNCLQTYGALSQPSTRECHRCHKPWIKTFAYKEESTGTWAKVRPKPAYSKGPFNPCTRNNHTIDCPSPHSRQELALWSSFCETIEHDKRPDSWKKSTIDVKLSQLPTLFNMEKINKFLGDNSMELFCNACVTNVTRPCPYKYDHDDNDDDGLLACGHEISNVFRCVWDDISKEWLKVRRCPPDLKSGTKLSICHDKEAGDPCKRNDSCSFAHSKMEIKIWEIELRGKPSEDVPNPKDSTQPSPPVVLTNAEQSEEDEQENLSEATNQNSASSWSDVVSRSELRRRKKLEKKKPVIVAVRKMFPLPSKTVKDDNTSFKDITAATLANEIDSETESTTSCSDVGVMPSFEIDELSPRIPKVPNVNHQGHSFKEEVLEKIRNATEVTQIYVTKLTGIETIVMPRNDIQLEPRDGEETCKWTIEVIAKDNRMKFIAMALIDTKNKYSFTYLSVNDAEKYKYHMSSQEKPCVSLTIADEVQERLQKAVIEITAFTDVCGTFHEKLIINFGVRPYLFIPLSFSKVEGSIEASKHLIIGVRRLDDGSKIIHRDLKNVVMEKGIPDLNKQYELQTASECIPEDIDLDGISRVNYKQFLHCMLYIEEAERNNALECIFVQNAFVKMMQSYEGQDGLNFTQDEIFGIFDLPGNLSLDSREGRLVSRDVKSVLICFDALEHVAFEAAIKEISVTRAVVLFSKDVIHALGLKKEMLLRAKIQWQLSRQDFLRQHQSVDNVKDHLKILFHSGNQKESNKMVTDNPKIPLNANQKRAVSLILRPSVSKWPSPVIIAGPFGCGKSHTIQHAIVSLLRDDSCRHRILLCTRSNSAADLHVEKIDQQLSSQVNMLRVYYHERKLNTISVSVRKYCLFNGLDLRYPTREEALKSQIIVATLATCYSLQDLNLGADFFTYVFIDEAAQVLEVDALGAVTLAGPNSKVVLAGDAYQISPDVFSDFAKECHFNVSLLERLVKLFKDTNNPNLVLLCENYRSQEELVKFCFTAFYNLPDEIEWAQGLQLPNPQLPTLCMISVSEYESGKVLEQQSPNSLQFYNVKEVETLINCVQFLKSEWPSGWELENNRPQLKLVCIVAFYYGQVKIIRNQLRINKLRGVTVETIDNIQGKEYRVILLSTVRSYHSLKQNKFQTGNLGFLSDPKLLNTAITRAKSQVIVVGDAYALCSFGESKAIWRRYIEACNEVEGLLDVSLENLRALSDDNHLEAASAGLYEGAKPSNADDDHNQSTASEVPQQESSRKDSVSKKKSGKKTTASQSENRNAAGTATATAKMTSTSKAIATTTTNVATITTAANVATTASKEKSTAKSTSNVNQNGVASGGKAPVRTPPGFGNFPIHGSENVKETVMNALADNFENTATLDVSKSKDNKGRIKGLDFLLMSVSEAVDKVKSKEKFVLCRVLPRKLQDCYHGEIIFGNRKQEIIQLIESTKPCFLFDVVLAEILESSDDVQGSALGIVHGIVQPAIHPSKRVFYCRYDDQKKLLVDVVDGKREIEPHGGIVEDADLKICKVELVGWNASTHRPRGNVIVKLEKTQWNQQTLDLRRGVERPFGGVERPALYQHKMVLLNYEAKILIKFPDEVLGEAERAVSLIDQMPQEANRKSIIDGAVSIMEDGETGIGICFTAEKSIRGIFTVGVHVIDVAYFMIKDGYLDLIAKYREESYTSKSTGLKQELLPQRLLNYIATMPTWRPCPSLSFFLKFKQDGSVVEDGSDLQITWIKSPFMLLESQLLDVIAGKVPDNSNGQIKNLYEVSRKISASMQGQKNEYACSIKELLTQVAEREFADLMKELLRRYEDQSVVSRIMSAATATSTSSEHMFTSPHDRYNKIILQRIIKEILGARPRNIHDEAKQCKKSNIMKVPNAEMFWPIHSQQVIEDMEHKYGKIELSQVINGAKPQILIAEVSKYSNESNRCFTKFSFPLNAMLPIYYENWLFLSLTESNALHGKKQIFQSQRSGSTGDGSMVLPSYLSVLSSHHKEDKGTADGLKTDNSTVIPMQVTSKEISNLDVFEFEPVIQFIETDEHKWFCVEHSQCPEQMFVDAIHPPCLKESDPKKLKLKEWQRNAEVSSAKNSIESDVRKRLYGCELMTGGHNMVVCVLPSGVVLEGILDGDYVCVIKGSPKLLYSMHGVISSVKREKNSSMDIRVTTLHERIPDIQYFIQMKSPVEVDVIQRPPRCRALQRSLQALQSNGNGFAHAVILGGQIKQELNTGQDITQPQHSEIQMEKELQNLAVQVAKQRFGVVRGLPGSGKTTFAAYLAMLLSSANKRVSSLRSIVLLCSPYESTVFQLTAILATVKDLNIVALPNFGQVLKETEQTSDERKLPENTSLRDKIRKFSPFKKTIARFEANCNDSDPSKRAFYKKELKMLTGDGIEYMLHEASLDVIICTCTAAASVLQYTNNIKQLIVDDCTETDTIIPFTCNPEQVILLGDSIIASDLKKSDSVIATSLSKCLDNAPCLSMQFDMHPVLCQMLGVLGGESVVSMRSMEDIRASVRSIKFCEVSGHPISFTIEDTKFWMNKTQEKRAEEIKKEILENEQTASVAIVSPYSSQSYLASFKEKRYDYVIYTTARSLPYEAVLSNDEITDDWVTKNVGVAGSKSLLTLVLSRARKGFIVLGNQRLLSTCETWKTFFRELDKIEHL